MKKIVLFSVTVLSLLLWECAPKYFYRNSLEFLPPDENSNPFVVKGGLKATVVKEQIEYSWVNYERSYNLYIDNYPQVEGGGTDTYTGQAFKLLSGNTKTFFPDIGTSFYDFSYQLPPGLCYMKSLHFLVNEPYLHIFQEQKKGGVKLIYQSTHDLLIDFKVTNLKYWAEKYIIENKIGELKFTFSVVDEDSHYAVEGGAGFKIEFIDLPSNSDYLNKILDQIFKQNFPVPITENYAKYSRDTLIQRIKKSVNPYILKGSKYTFNSNSTVSISLPIFKDNIPEILNVDMEISPKGYNFIKTTCKLKPTDSHIEILASELGTKVRLTNGKTNSTTKIIIR
jgi:hypothetical protein